MEDDDAIPPPTYEPLDSELVVERRISEINMMGIGGEYPILYNPRNQHGNRIRTVYVLNRRFPQYTHRPPRISTDENYPLDPHIPHPTEGGDELVTWMEDSDDDD